MDGSVTAGHSESVALRPPIEGGWSSHRASHKRDEKILMAEYYALHDFLVREGSDPEADPRETVASVLVNQGTTQYEVVERALEWIEANQESGAFDITWYATGGLVHGALRDFRKRNPHLSSASQVFLFPGKVDPGLEAVSGPEAAEFAEHLQRCFTFALLSAHSFDISEGKFYFHYSDEVRLQKACAKLYAAHKFLFLDSSKFKREGYIGYAIDELLATSQAVTIYTVSSSNDKWIKAKFEALCDQLMQSRDRAQPAPEISIERKLDMKSLRLRIIGQGQTPTDSAERKGFLP